MKTLNTKLTIALTIAGLIILPYLKKAKTFVNTVLLIAQDLKDKHNNKDS